MNTLRTILVALLLLAFAESSVFHLRDEPLEENTLDIYQVGMFTYDDAPFRKDVPYISFDVTFSQPAEFPEALNLQVVLYHSEVDQYVGKEIGDTVYACCYDSLYNQSQCDTPGKLIVQPEARSYPQFYLWNIEWTQVTNSDGTTSVVAGDLNISTTIPISKSGVWIWAAVHCGDSADDVGHVIKAKGELRFVNSYGHMQGDNLGLIPIYFILLVLYIGLAIWWFGLRFLIGEPFLLLQKFIGVVIIAGVVESFLYFVNYVVYNSNGQTSVAFNVICIIAITFMRTIRYICLIMITSGYSVITIQATRNQKIAWSSLAIVYSVISFIYEVLDMLVSIEDNEFIDIPDGAVTFMLTLNVIIDIIIFIWIFYTLWRTMSFLATNKQIEKLNRFMRLLVVLATAYLVSLVFFIIEASAEFTGRYFSWWKGWWVFPSYWVMLFYFLTMIVAFLWRPDGNSKRFAYSEQLQDEPNSTDLTELPKSDEEPKNPFHTIGDDEDLERATREQKARNDEDEPKKKEDSDSDSD